MTHTLVVTLSALCALSAVGCVVTTSADPATPPASEPAPAETAPADPSPESPGLVAPVPIETPAPDLRPADPAPTAGAACTSDADCVPASCCHATACMARGAAPSCENTMCTKECRGGTLDCGGHCLCQKGTCAASINAMR